MKKSTISKPATKSDSIAALEDQLSWFDGFAQGQHLEAMVYEVEGELLASVTLMEGGRGVSLANRITVETATAIVAALWTARTL